MHDLDTLPAAADQRGPGNTADPQPRPVRLSGRSRALLGLISVLIATVTAVQLAAMFLEAAPRNTVSQRYRAQLSWWTEPWLEQDWRLFAPDPQTSNQTIRARARTADGTAGPWVDLTAADYAAVAHDPMPSQANQNELRRAWDAYAASRSASGAAATPRAQLVQQYLANIAARRLAGSVAGRFTAVQLQVVSTPIPPPTAAGTSAAASAPTTRSTPWLPL
jgi:hypothetical protein